MDLDFLKKIPLVKEFTEEQLKIFSKELKRVSFKKDEFIIKEDEMSDKMYILCTGEVIISKKISLIDDQEKVEKTFIHLKDKDYVFIGEIGLLGMQKRTANCIAKTDCDFYSLDHKSFLKISEKYPRIGNKILIEITRKLSGLVEKTNSDVLKLTTALIYALKN